MFFSGTLCEHRVALGDQGVNSENSIVSLHAVVIACRTPTDAFVYFSEHSVSRWQIFLHFNTQIGMKDPLLSGLRVATMDSSSFGRFYAVVCEFPSDPPVWLEFDPIANKGRELPGARKLIRKITQQLGWHRVDIIFIVKAN
jgi:hypothetical protein